MYASHDLIIENVTILEGESAIKECSNLERNTEVFRHHFL